MVTPTLTWAAAQVDLVRLLPQQPHTNEDLSIEVLGRVPQDAALQEQLGQMGQAATPLPD